MLRHQAFFSLGQEGFHRVAYTDWGDRACRHVVICAHGLSRNSRDFDRLAARLASDCRVVCMDVVGRGDSDWLADKSGYSFQTYLNDAAALIARVTTPIDRAHSGQQTARLLAPPPVTGVDWIGTSMGGLIGMLLAAKPGTPIRRLVLNDVGAFVPWSALIRLKGHVGARTRFATLDDAEEHLRHACVSFGPADDAWWAHLREHGTESLPGGGFRLRHDPDIGRGLPVQRDPELPIGPDFMRGIDLWSIWREIRCPVLIVRGEHSDVLPRDVADEMQSLHPATRLLELPDVGHAPWLAAPDQIDAVHKFLLAGEADDEEADDAVRRADTIPESLEESLP